MKQMHLNACKALMAQSETDGDGLLGQIVIGKKT
jgi:hypothetical protein